MDVLQLYEFSMAIGRSFDYKENCNSLLRLIMARKDLNSCWIYTQREGECKITYSIPEKHQLEVMNSDKCIVKELHDRGDNFSSPITDDIQKIAPFQLNGGAVAVFNLKDEGLLFLYGSKRDAFLQMEINQLSPIIEKFRVSLEASDVFRKREILLHNLEKQNKELSDYAHVVSHDLKSPIRNIETLLTWVRQDYENLIDEKGIETFSLISDNLERMDSLIDGILKYSTIDKENTGNQTVDLSDLLAKTISSIKVPAHVSIEVETELPTIQGNLFTLHQLFQNLIENSIKYSDKPFCQIRVGARKVEEGNEFYVKDNGMGIEAKYFDKIFQVFQSLDGNQKSSGIGLSVVKKIVDSYGGKVWLESEKGLGTTFFFTLPVN
ncbi:histidine kinase/DNA gyrase B/HSP90-like ATPase [Roseivirga ehrenbergii]|nr:histidine kinase/DNA gyrase B/HSP90-like ATPase [Roseivirga ehrenbergii]